MKRSSWIGGVARPEIIWCEKCGNIIGKDGLCHGRHPLPEFELVSNPRVPYHQLFTRRYNVIDRVRQRTQEAVHLQEDANIFAAWQANGGGDAAMLFPMREIEDNSDILPSREVQEEVLRELDRA